MVVVVLISAPITAGIGGRVLAGNECAEQPDREPSQGAHWYYHYDREKDRKCWHLDVAVARAPEAMPSLKDQSDTAVASAPTIGSVFSVLFGAGAAASSVSMPQDTVAGEPRIIQSDPTKPLKIEDIAQQQPSIPEERAEQRYITPLNAAQRAALFQEYLRWDEIQRNLGAPARAP
jgi:hypothetical protein